jgi:hypothetical protein
LPLEIRLVERIPKSNMYSFSTHQEFDSLFATIGERIGSLELAFTSDLFDGQLPGVMRNCLAYCTPGRLVRFSLKFRPVNMVESFSTTDSEHEDADDDELEHFGAEQFNSVFNVPDAQHEDLLSSVRILNLYRAFPWWTSRAYHGLVELRLVSWGPARDSAKIKEPQLVRILQSSPGLKLLHFGIEIAPSANPYPPVLLGHLEELKIQTGGRESQRILLRLLSPGTKPLEAFINYRPMTENPGTSLEAETEFYEFIGRSNITTLHLESTGMDLHPPTFLQLMPHLRVLTLYHTTFGKINQPFVSPTQGTPVYPKLHAIHFNFGIVHLEGLRWLCDTQHLQRATIYQSSIEVGPEPQSHRSVDYIRELKELCPVLEVLNNDKVL